MRLEASITIKHPTLKCFVIAIRVLQMGIGCMLFQKFELCKAAIACPAFKRDLFRQLCIGMSYVCCFSRGGADHLVNAYRDEWEV